MKGRILPWICGILAVLLLSGCGPEPVQEPTIFSAGFASRVLEPEGLSTVYIAGYHNGLRPEGQLDDLMVSALWLDDGAASTVLLSVDCVGLSSETVGQIRRRLKDFCRETGCQSVNVISTHTHAGVDTLGLWGPVGLNGKNEHFQAQLLEAAAAAAEEAYEARTPGSLFYGAAETTGLQHDSRYPHVYDRNLYQLRFVPEDGGPGIRILSFGAHAEALRGGNRLLSSDYPGQLRSIIGEKTGDRVLFLPGAVGGLIMTTELVVGDAVANLQATGEKLAQYALSPGPEAPVSPELRICRQEFETPLENTLFLYYKFLGILGNEVRRTSDGTYLLQTEVTVLTLGDVGLILLPGEIFPELIAGTGREEDPEGLRAMAARYGLEKLIFVGLANDEIGYVVPPGDFLLDETAPYVREAKNHYEETNSLGPNCSRDLAEALEQALKSMQDS